MTSLPRRPVPSDVVTVATGLGFPEGPIACADGSVIVVEVRGEALTRVLPDGRLERIAALPGGPNGAAVGPDGAVYVCNNGGLPWTQLASGAWYPMDASTGSMQPESYTHGWIERIDPSTGTVDRLYESSSGHPLSAPNDLCFTSDGELWFTDTGKTDARRTMLGSVHRAAADGSAVRCAAFGLMGPNGIALSPDERRLVMADTPTGRVWQWSLDAAALDGTTPRQHGGHVIATFPDGMALDSLAIDAEGRVVVALPGTSALGIVETDGSLSLLDMPGPMPTNICFGGPDGCTAFVTMGGLGELVSFRWPCAGAPLPFTI